MASPALFSLEHLGIPDILEYNTDSDAALRQYCSTPVQPRFLLLTKNEVDELRDELIKELDLTCSLSILSALEAAFRVDYLQRCRKKLKEPISRDFRKLYKNRFSKASLEKDILPRWRQHYPAQKNLIDQFGRALKYRHWLAHGRYWIIKPNTIYDFQTLYLICSQIITSLPLQDAE